MRTTASKVALLERCAWWATPGAAWSDEKSEEAAIGDRVHDAGASYVRSGGKADPVDMDISQMVFHLRRWLDGLGVPFKRLIVETSFAWDPDTDAAEVIGENRDYSKGNGRLCGTADLVMLTMVDGKPVAAMVWDYKTGIWSGHTMQLRTLGLMVARAYGVDAVTVAALDVSDTGVVESEREELDAFDLSAHAGELADLLRTPDADGVDANPGPWCGEEFCPARASCPAGATALAQVIPAEALTTPRRFSLADPIETPEHAAWALDVMRLVAARLEFIKDDLKAKLPKEGWKLENGAVLREGSCTTTGFSKDEAIALCKELGATEEQLARLTYSYQKSTGLRVVGGPKKTRVRKTKEKAA